ncbi:hypothetical protein TFLX_00801 [Thermoflexales bacterium]|nr:hypothetical protein TFLX_00801 [Thermoflexales bacterium]
MSLIPTWLPKDHLAQDCYGQIVTIIAVRDNIISTDRGLYHITKLSDPITRRSLTELRPQPDPVDVSPLASLR